MEAITHLEKVIVGEVSAVTHLEKVIAGETSAVTYTEKVITGEATPITHLQRVIAGVESPVTHLEYVWAGRTPEPTEHEYTGAVPVTFTADGTPLLDFLISGNMSQTGTPTSTDPIQPSECGERTGNLFDYVSYFDSTFTNYNQFFDYADLQLSANTTYTLSTSYTELGTSPRNTSFIVAKPNDVPTTASGGISSTSPITITTGSDGKLRLYKRISGSSEHPTKSQFDNGEWLMLNSGSTALPYEPYGYKIPISSANTTTPVYLGEVESERKIKQFVFDGTENWQLQSINTHGIANFYISLLTQNRAEIAPVISSHYVQQNSLIADTTTEGILLAAPSTIYIRCDTTRASTKEDFKSYLAAQYAAGTPVCVWYVLATPTTGIVNEPLRKIGDYADTLSMEQAGVSIPTNNGSTTVDVDTTLKPSEVYIKYKGV